MAESPLSGFFSRPRTLGAALLAALAAVLFYVETPAQAWMRNTLFDAYQFVSPRERASAPAVIIAIDEKSLARYGQWPWPRTLVARLIAATGSYRPLAIGVDILFPEPDRLSPDQLAARHPDVGPELAQALRALPSNDKLLAAVIREAPVVLGVAGTADGTAARPPRAAATFIMRGEPLPHLRQFPSAIASVEEIDRAARSRGLISADTGEGVVRRLPLVTALAGAPFPALSIETLRVAAGADGIEIRAGPHGVESLSLADIEIPVQSDGHLWVRYGRQDPERYVSAADVLDRQVDPARIENKLALVGVTGLGLLDQQVTPLAERIPGIEIHAQLLENIFDRNLLLRPHWAQWLETGALVVLGLILIAAVPAWSPPRAVVLLAAQIGALSAAGILAFQHAGLLFDAAVPSIALTLLFGGLLSATLIETERSRRRLKLALDAEREEAARMAGELEAARRVQLGMLPVAARAFPGERRFDLHALMTPTKEVGGDLYDFFMIGESRLFFMVGDVSGKGLAASIFMALSKALYKNAALRSGGDLAQAMSAANTEISRENPELMFVTVLACVLDLDSGELVWCNAGHETPYVLGSEGARALAGESGPPLCVIEGFEYTTNRSPLAPGETLMLVSDGVPEAMDPEHRLFGRARLQALLGELPHALNVEQTVNEVFGAVKGFSAGAEMADDVTILGVRWNGRDASGR